MFRKLMLAAAVASPLMLLAPSLSAAPVRFAHPYFDYYYGPFYRWYPGPGYFGPRVYIAPSTGELKINTDDKDARVWVDGGYLGIARKTHKVDLRPGNHEVELRDARDNVLFEKRVAIVSGHTTEVNAMGVAG